MLKWQNKKKDLEKKSINVPNCIVLFFLVIMRLTLNFIIWRPTKHCVLQHIQFRVSPALYKYTWCYLARSPYVMCVYTHSNSHRYALGCIAKCDAMTTIASCASPNKWVNSTGWRKQFYLTKVFETLNSIVMNSNINCTWIVDDARMYSFNLFHLRYETELLDVDPIIQFHIAHWINWNTKISGFLSKYLRL